MSDSPSPLVARAGWKNPDAYPSVDMDNPEHWAWEFLRRSQRYAEDVIRSPLLTPQEREAVRLQWETNQLISPEVAWHQLPRDFRFLANIAEIIEPTLPLASRNPRNVSLARLATEQSLLATSRQMLVRLTLDGNIDNQLQDLREKFWQRNHRHPETGENTNKALTQIIFDDVTLTRTETDTLPDGSQITRNVYEDNWDDSPSEQLELVYCEDPKRVSVRHLLFALRSVDAVAAYYTDHPDSALSTNEVIQHVARQLQPVLHAEWNQEGRYSDSLAAGDLDRIQLYQVTNWIRYGLQYTQEERYREIASSDLHKQFDKIKKKKADA